MSPRARQSVLSCASVTLLLAACVPCMWANPPTAAMDPGMKLPTPGESAVLMTVALGLLAGGLLAGVASFRAGRAPPGRDGKKP